MVAELAVGQLIGRYRLTRPLAEGGMGSVWAAVDTRLDRDVALKLLPRLLVSDPSVERRFEREARALARLHHPNIVSVFDVGTAAMDDGSGVPYLVMALVAGRPLQEIVARGPVPPARAARLLSQIAAGLAAVHAAGVIHRDLKPSNVMVGDGDHVTLLDFGLARLLPTAAGSPEESLTVPGMVLGSCSYMAPEQARGDGVTPASDVFAAGAVGWEILSGRRLFDGGTPLQVLQSVVRCDVPPLAESAPATPCPLARVVERCLARDPADRFADGAELVAALRALPPVAAAADGPAAPAARRPWRRRWLVAAVGLVAAAALGAVGAHLLTPAPPPSTPPVVRQLAAPGGRLSGPVGDAAGGVLAVADGGPRSDLIAVSGGGATTLLSLADGRRWADPAPSADGRLLAVAVVQPTTGSSEVRVLPLAGGPPVAVIPDAASPVWLDPRRIAFLRPSDGALVVTGLGGAPPHELAADGAAGRWVALAGHPTAGLLAQVTLDGDRIVRWPPDLRGERFWWGAGAPIDGMAWRSDGAAAVVSSGGRLMEVPAGGEARALVSWPGLGPVGAAVAPDRVVAVVREAWRELVSVPVTGGGPVTVTVRLPGVAGGRAISGGAVVFRRDAGSRRQWWVRRADGVEAPVECGAGEVLGVAPDAAVGKIACLVATATGPVELRLAGGATGAPRTVAADVSPAVMPAWSADGRQLAFLGRRPDAVVVLEPAAGTRRVVAETRALGLAFSPDGGWLLYRVPPPAGSEPVGVWTVSLAPGELPRRVTERPGPVAWRPGGGGLWQLRPGGNGLELWETPLAGSWRLRDTLAVDGVELDEPVFAVDSSGQRVLLWRTVGSDRLVEISAGEGAGAVDVAPGSG